MPEITGKSLFKGANDIHSADLGKSEVANFSTSIDRVLKEDYKWQGKAIGTIGLCFTPDNSKVLNGEFIVRGRLEDARETRFSCLHIWPQSTGEASLLVNFPSANIFRFDEGGLWSNPVPSAQIIHTYHAKDNRVISADEREHLNIGDFSARMICQVSSTSGDRHGVRVKYMIIIFPCSAGELSDNAESRFPGYPGIKVGEGSFPMGPKPSVAWCCPIVPFSIPGAPFAEVPSAPSSQRLRAAIAAVMRKAGQPDNLRNGAAVIEKWERIRAHPRELAVNIPLTTWPELPPVPETQGRRFFHSLIHINTLFLETKFPHQDHQNCLIPETNIYL